MAVKRIFDARFPLLYKSLQRVWHAFREFLERRVIGHRLQEWIWRTRHLYDHQSAGFSVDSAWHPHRQQILDSVALFSPVASILEVGCGYGANLVRLRESFPDTELHGVDINPQAIAFVLNHFKHQTGRAVLLRIGCANRLGFVADKSIELVITDAVLMFVAPDNIRETLAELGRVSHRGMILNEYQISGALEGQYEGGRWVYDLVGLCRDMFPAARVKTMKSAYTGSDWTRFGTLITVQF